MNYKKLLCLVFLFILINNFLFAEELAHAIFIKVNGRSITQDNVIQASRYLIKREYKGVLPADEEEQERIQEAALRDLIRTYLIIHEANQLGIKADRDALKRAISSTGLKQEEITPTIRHMLQADDLFESIMLYNGTPISQPTPKEIKDFYTQHKEEFRLDSYIIARSIFIPGDTSRPQSYFKSRAEDLRKQIESIPINERTEAFIKAAKDNSKDVFANYGGLLTASIENPWMPQDFVNRNQDGSEIFPAPMYQGIKNLSRPGEISLIISQDGIHLLYLEAIQGGKLMPWDEASKVIEHILRQRKKNRRLRSWLNRIFDRSDVTWHDGTSYAKKDLQKILLPSERKDKNIID